MQHLNFANLREGDFVFSFKPFPLGWITRWLTKGLAGHVGQLIDKYGNGQLYMAEMIGDLNPKSNDLCVNSLKQFDGRRNRIVDIRRAAAYDNATGRKFRERALQQRVNYDYRELLSFVTGSPDRRKGKLICSGWCFQNGVADGVEWSTELVRKHYAPSPEELRLQAVLLDVDWR